MPLPHCCGCSKELGSALLAAASRREMLLLLTCGCYMAFGAVWSAAALALKSFWWFCGRDLAFDASAALLRLL